MGKWSVLSSTSERSRVPLAGWNMRQCFHILSVDIDVVRPMEIKMDHEAESEQRF